GHAGGVVDSVGAGQCAIHADDSSVGGVVLVKKKYVRLENCGWLVNQLAAVLHLHDAVSLIKYK
ncbi:MAG: hypothetical protein FWC92_12065, partial [Defluviitaleaceae bacterium]|nr:hypothetical protein [Defluviitaleaceae bacterium]